MAERLLAGQLQQALKLNNISVTVEEWRILFYLWKEDAVSQRELAIMANKEKSTITRQIDSLENKGLLVRNSQQADKRNKLIVLTEKGRMMEAEALKVARDITQSAEASIASQDLEVFKRVIRQIIKNIS